MENPFKIFRLLPIYLAISYLATTIALFFWGPFDWPIRNTATLGLFLGASLVSMTVGFDLGSRLPATGGQFRAWRLCSRVGALASIALLFPSTWAYTGKWPWEVGSVLSNQGIAYSEMLSALEANESGIRAHVAIVRTVFAPFVFCVIPFSILHWKHLRRSDAALLLLHVLSILIFSLMRGTDRETVDLIVIIGGSLFILIARWTLSNQRFPFYPRRVTVVLLTALVVLATSFALFLDRKESRMGGDEAFCVGERLVCSTRHANQSAAMTKLSFGTEMLTAYMSQGYYGLSLALQEDFFWTYGFGHSAFLMDSVGTLVDESLNDRSYLAKINAAGWDTKAQWSTVFPWLASDLGFPLVPFAMAFLSLLWGASWRSSVVREDDTGALIFLLSCIAVLYIPANNQISQTLDSYFSAIFWLFLWMTAQRFGTEDRPTANTR